MHPFIHLSIGFWLYTSLLEQYVVEFSGLLHFWGYFIEPCCLSIFNFFSTVSTSSWVNGPSLMSNCLLIILVIGSWVASGGFPSKFSKCCFQRCIRSCWLVAFSLALAVLFLLLTSFIVYHAILGCPRGVMVKAMNCGTVVREFVLQSRYYVHFRANTLGKGMNPLILPPAMGK